MNRKVAIISVIGCYLCHYYPFIGMSPSNGQS